MIVLGPGPGHPDKYQSLYKSIRLAVLQQFQILGICLGHQIILRSFGFDIKKDEDAIHGFSVKIQLNQDWKNILQTSSSNILVQRYNSLEILYKKHELIKTCLLYKKNRVYGMKFLNTLSYQFHPESIGTQHPYQFFKTL